MDATPLALPGLLLLKPRRFADERGFVVEHFKAADLPGMTFVQDNASFSSRTGTVRGLHCQVPPRGQAKLISVLTGSILDVVVDVRTGSPTYGRHLSLVLDAAEGAQLYIPEGFLHGFITQAPDTLVFYKISDGYAPDCERAVAWNDPDLAIDWGPLAAEPVLSAKDAAAAAFDDFASPFVLEGATAGP
ncbi:dTDP-4-dehydrorhamnose 3,5-epimerase [soil metagenome]